MSDGVIVWNSRDPLGGLSRDEFEARLKALLLGRVAEAWIFGSYDTDDFGPDSDVDLFLVVDTAKPFIERGLDFADILGLVPDMDLLVYTPGEFAALAAEPSPGFWTSAVASMRRIV